MRQHDKKKMDFDSKKEQDMRHGWRPNLRLGRSEGKDAYPTCHLSSRRESENRDSHDGGGSWSCKANVKTYCRRLSAISGSIKVS